MVDQEQIFARVQEQQELRARMIDRRTFLLHGGESVGKTFLLKGVCQELPRLIYCEANRGMQQLCRQIALSLLKSGNRAMQSKLGPDPAVKVRSITSISLRGIVTEALQQERYYLVLDQFGFASQQFASMVKTWAAGPAAVVIVARSAHMEEIGYAASLFAERRDRFRLDNFDPETALRFSDWMVQMRGLQAENLGEFKRRIVELSRGNPGMIARLVQHAGLPKYRSGHYIKVTPLYLDCKLHGSAGAQLP